MICLDPQASPAAVDDGGGRDAVADDLQLAGVVAGHKAHTHAAQVGDPGVDPGLAGRSVEQPVGRPITALLADLRRCLGHRGVDEGQRHQTYGAGGGLRALGGHQVLGEPGAEHTLVLGREPLGVDVVPPRDLLPFAHAPRVAAGLKDLHLPNEVLDLVRRDLRGQPDGSDERPHALGEPRLVEAREEPHLAGVEHEELLLGVDEVVEHAIGVAGDRDAPHRVGHVLVEAGKEAKAVLAGQVGAAPCAGAGDGDAAGLAAQCLGLEDGDLEASLGQLVGDGQPADSATEHHHARRQAAGRRLA